MMNSCKMNIFSAKRTEAVQPFIEEESLDKSV